MTAERLRADFRNRFTPEGAILSIAGMFEWGDLVKAVEEVFGGWERKAAAAIVEEPALRGTDYVKQETNQSQIGLAWDTVAEANPDSILMQTAMNVLSGGMGARLFTEIREKQGLCYSVHAGYSSLKHVGGDFWVFGHGAGAGAADAGFVCGGDASGWRRG